MEDAWPQELATHRVLVHVHVTRLSDGEVNLPRAPERVSGIVVTHGDLSYTHFSNAPPACAGRAFFSLSVH